MCPFPVGSWGVDESHLSLSHILNLEDAPFSKLPHQTQGLSELNWQEDFQTPAYERSPK